MTNRFGTATAASENQLASWLNEAATADNTTRAELICKCAEVLVHQCPHLLPSHIDILLSYVADRSADVKKQIVQFIEHISEKHPKYIPRCVSQLRLLLTDEVIAVQKRVVQAASLVYKRALVWMCKGDGLVSEMRQVWEQLTQLKLQILNMIDNDNEGIRTNSIKFLEGVVVLQTSDDVGETTNDFSLDDIPITLTFVRRRALEEESEHIFTLLLRFHNSQHISSVNLMACMTALCSLAKFRPKYMSRVIQALADLHTTLPPTLTQSQVNSVRKHLKMQLLNLIKHPSSTEMLPHLTQLLSDIGMTPQEIAKAVPRERRNKRVHELRNGEGGSKRQRIDSPQSNSQGSQDSDKSDFILADDSDEIKRPEVEIVVTEETVLEGLQNVDNVINLVISTLTDRLPEEVPSEFLTLYKPIPNSGTHLQKRNLSRMLTALIKDETVLPPPSSSEITSKIPMLKEDDEKLTLKNAVAKLNETEKLERQIEGAVSRLMEENRQDHIKEQQQQTVKEKEQQEKLPVPQTPTIPRLKQKVKMLKLQEITRPIPKEIKERLIIQAVERILKVEQEATIAGISNIRSKIITTFASSYTTEMRDLILSYILDDAMGRIDLALSWLYEEYSFMQGFNRHPVTLPPKMNEKHDQNYNSLLCALIIQISERGDPTMENARDLLLRRIYLEVPVITEDAIDYLKHLATEESTSRVALELLEEIVIKRPPRAHKYVAALLSHTINENEEIRETSTQSVIKIYMKCSESVRKVIEKYANLYLAFIALNSPPMDLYTADSGRLGERQVWSDNLYRICLNLIMALFSVKEDMLIDIARVYGSASADAKRCVLRCAETGIRRLTADSPAAKRLLTECPRGAETLLTRTLHILTEREPPTPELVSQVRDLYATRVSDVRFLIPVLNGLTKKEILAALPKLIKLNPVVVKEVFNKLLGLGQNNNEEDLPVSPAELLVALHLIDQEKADLKYVIKTTALCFAEKSTYTQDVVALVLTRLMDEDEIPVLMMRTVLQALTLYPGLVGLVLNLLQRLIEKEVWNNKVAWEGWIKCCERTTPASFTALLSLPPAPLAACLSSSSMLATKLASHVALLTPAQRAHLSPHARALAAPPAVPSPHVPPAPLGVPPPDDYQDTPYLEPKPTEPLPPGME